VSERLAAPSSDPPPTPNQWGLPVALIGATFLSTFFVGALMAGAELERPADIAKGWVFAVPLMAILLAHEFGHFLAGRFHRVDVSPPFFIPMPIVFLGTMGAVIRIRRPIRRRNALLDVGAAGPLAGLAVALPVLAYGIAISPIEAPPASGVYLEGRSVLYVALLFLLKGPIPDGQDVMLSPTAFAGWAGLLVTMMNLLPVGQLDGGHVAYALLGPAQNRYSELVRKALPVAGVLAGLGYGGAAYIRGETANLWTELLAGWHWWLWAVVLWLMTRAGGPLHPPTGPEPLSRGRRLVGAFTLLLFPLLFMPSWIRAY
jgi:membrane-associated protease RseP (regulator of RpoE activity)